MDKIAIELSKLPFIETINALKAEIDSYKHIENEIEDKVFQKLKLDWNYNSNAIEGNKLNYGETVAFLMHGITAKGKTLKDHLDIKGHNEAINFLLGLVKEDRDITESDIRALHKMILVEEYEVDAITQDGQPTKKRIKLGTYKTTPNSVRTRTGEMHYYASVEETPLLMAELMKWYNENKNKTEIHPLILASLFHFKFVAIHPFDDGNGRLARILMNLILLRNNFPVVVVKNEDKDNYYGVLAQADSNQFIPLIEYTSELLQHSLNLYLKGIKGESIEEESDIDKEIELFKQGLDKNIFLVSRTENKIIDIIDTIFYDTSKYIISKLKKFEELFLESNFDLGLDIDDVSYKTYDLQKFLKDKSGYLYKLKEFDTKKFISIEIGYDFCKSIISKDEKCVEGFFSIIFLEQNFVIQTFGDYYKEFSYSDSISKDELRLILDSELKRIFNEIKQLKNN